MPHVTFLGGDNVFMRGTEAENRKFVYCPSEDVPFILDVTGITPPNKNYYISRNCCDHYVLMFIPRGSGDLDYNGIHYDLQPSDAVLIEPGSRSCYKASADDPFELIWANFFCDYMDSYLSGIGLKGTPVIRGVDCERKMREIVSLAMQDPNNDHLCFPVMRIVDEVLLTLAETLHFEKQRAASHLAHAIKDLLDACVYKRFDVNEATEKLHISKSSLYREFARFYNTSPHQYVLQRKIDLAKTLLLRTDVSVKDVSNTLAFSDEFYFSNLFKQKTGVSPSAFRRGPDKTSAPPPVTDGHPLHAQRAFRRNPDKAKVPPPVTDGLYYTHTAHSAADFSPAFRARRAFARFYVSAICKYKKPRTPAVFSCRFFQFYGSRSYRSTISYAFSRKACASAVTSDASASMPP